MYPVMLRHCRLYAGFYDGISTSFICMFMILYSIYSESKHLVNGRIEYLQDGLRMII